MEKILRYLKGLEEEKRRGGVRRRTPEEGTEEGKVKRAQYLHSKTHIIIYKNTR